MPLAPEKLRILTFPQRIAGDQLELRLMLIPTQRTLNDQTLFPSVLNPPGAVSLPRFITANPSLTLTAVKGLSAYPFSDPAVLASEGASATPVPAGVAFPPGLPALYEGLASRFKIDPVPPSSGAGAPRPDSQGVRKHLPLTYRQAFNFTRPRTPYASTDETYACAISGTPAPDPTFANSPDAISWGRVIAFCLRQPDLARRAGLVFKTTVTVPAADYFKDGGWIWADLTSAAAEFGIVDPALELKRYAARIPPIDTPRPLFAPLLFPVVPGPAAPGGDFDSLKIETSDYDDGFAKIVHAVQPVSANLLAEAPDGLHVQKEMGVRLGWDDEQILIWQNRQLLADPTMPGQRIDAPLGVFSYRVDVRLKGAADFESLVLQRNKAALTLAGETISPAGEHLETGVQVFPTRLNAAVGTLEWLPSYFTQWYGASLVLPDPRAAELDASGALADPGTYQGGGVNPHPEQKGGLYQAIEPKHTELKYGHEYEFRVRLADLAGGGPRVSETARNDAPAPSSTLVFKRYVAPKQPTVEPVSPQPNPDSTTAKFLVGTDFRVSRPRLGYPALLFTQMNSATAFKKLLDDKTLLHTGKKPGQTITDPRAVGWFDPDVDQLLVVVEVRTLAMDTLESLDQREAFIPLYVTRRAFDADPETALDLTLEYRDANVIDFGNGVDFGDLGVSQAQLDAGGPLVLPRSRDIRITLYPNCSDKPDLTAYFGFATTDIAGQPARVGEPTRFFVREDGADEIAFFRHGLESHQVRGLYLQPDPIRLVDPLSLTAEVVEGKALAGSTVMQRLAAALDVDFKGLSLIGRPGQRIAFGCSNRIRHTLSPDNASLTFATDGELSSHWLMALDFDLQRDWTWDGLAEQGIEVRRDRAFTNEPATAETGVVGYVSPRRTASRLAITGPDRSTTRVLFIDAIEPKKDATLASTQLHPFPNTIDASYTLTPAFIASVAPAAGPREAVSRAIQLPATTIPAQTLKVIAAGYAQSPYRQTPTYSETGVRQRWLWLEFDQPVADPHDTVFVRVLTYAPDPLISWFNPDQIFAVQDDPPLAIDPEPIRIITPGLGNDGAGLGAMQAMTAETNGPGVPGIKLSPTHYLVPLPPGLYAESPELFGFFTVELRVGHTNALWSTAQGRYGHPTRVNGLQHPAPPLQCLVDRTPDALKVTAPYGQAVFGGRNVTASPPNTELWALLYAQVMEADGSGFRNLLLAEQRLEFFQPGDFAPGRFLAGRNPANIRAFNGLAVNLDAPATGQGQWASTEILGLLAQYDLDRHTALSVLAVEMMPRYDRFILPRQAPNNDVQPLSRDLGRYRILRTSPLTAAPEVC